ncbi:putative polysaccharide biosynthesis protein [Sporomusa acidovorans]|nr:polysaccharide biosynthesis protein [Sporomusa acidovorans]
MKQQDDIKRKPNRLLQGTLVLTIGGMVVKVIGSLNWIILSRVLGGEGIGLYQMAFPVYLLALSLSSAGIPVAISIITAEKVALQDYRGANRVFYLSLAILTATGIALSTLVYFGAEWLIEYKVIRDPRAYYALLALSPAILLVTLLSSFRGYLQGWQNMTPTAVSQIVEQLFRVGAMLLFAVWLLPRGIEYAAGGASMGAGAGAAAGLGVLLYYYWRLQRKCKQELPQEKPKLYIHEPAGSIVRRIVVLALPVSLASIMLPLVQNLDLLIVPARLEVAGYTVEQATELFGYLTGMGVPLVNLATIITAALATSIVPAVSEAKSLGDTGQIRERAVTAMRLTTIVTIPAVAGLWVLGTPIAAFVYHAPAAGEVVRVLSWGVYLLGIHQVTTGVLQGMGYTVLPVINMGIAAAAKVLLNWNLTAMPALGIQGAGWATNADFGVAALLNLYFVAKYTGFRMDLRGLWKSILAAAIMAASIDVIYQLMVRDGVGDAIATLFAICLAGIIYAAVLLMLGGLTENDVRRIPFLGLRLSRLFTKLGLLKCKSER